MPHTAPGVGVGLSVQGGEIGHVRHEGARVTWVLDDVVRENYETMEEPRNLCTN